MKLKFLGKMVKHGSLHVHLPRGKVNIFGEGAPEAHIHLRSKTVIARMLSLPELTFGESYMDGDWWPGEGGLLRIFELYFANESALHKNGLLKKAWRALEPIVKANNRLRSRDNVHRHYDIDPELFHHFLDKDLHYSCAYFETPDASLEAAQQAKCRHIARKLCLQPGDKVLDIGSGWGGMALYMARNYAVDVTGLTLSDDQYVESNSRAQKAGLSSQVRFLKEDYREHGSTHGAGDYDAIVSIGMFEHVGQPQYQTYFDHVARLLKEDGRCLVHSIGHTDEPTKGGQPWIRKYIFPGGHIPALSEAALPIERTSLVLSDVEIWRLHYARTLSCWNERFQSNRDLFKERLGERFCRMWEFYLQSCEAGFRWGGLVVLHMQLAQRNNTIPLTRDYLYAPEEAATQRTRRAS